jgi:outer membrane lipoprotein carrier protein
MRASLALILTVALLRPQLVAGPSETAILVKKFEGKYKSSRTLRATFLQSYFDNGKLVRSEAGIAYFAKPGKMRWEYESPEPNLYVVDGKWSWFYVPADHTVTRVRAKESADARTPFALLAGEMRVSRICKSVSAENSIQPSDPEAMLLRCNLRQDDGATAMRSGNRKAHVFFELKSSNGELRRVIFADPGGVQVEFRFAHWEFDPRVEDSKFRFSPATGTAIVDGDFGSTLETPLQK